MARAEIVRDARTRARCPAAGAGWALNLDTVINEAFGGRRSITHFPDCHVAKEWYNRLIILRLGRVPHRCSQWVTMRRGRQPVSHYLIDRLTASLARTRVANASQECACSAHDAL